MIYLLYEYDIFTLPMSNQNTVGVEFLAKDRHLMNFWPNWAGGTVQEVKFSANFIEESRKKTNTKNLQET